MLERGDASDMPRALRWIERSIAVDHKRVRANHAMLAGLAKRADVTVFSAHDPVEYERLRAASAVARAASAIANRFGSQTEAPPCTP